jgi:hypothetical protein
MEAAASERTAAPPPPLPGAACSVCHAALEAPVRGTPGYRKSLASVRAGVCQAHLAGDHLVRGVLSRYCTNHHLWHELALFGGTASTTCVHARALAASRAKRQRTLDKGAHAGGTGPSCGSDASPPGVLGHGVAGGASGGVAASVNPLRWSTWGFELPALPEAADDMALPGFGDDFDVDAWGTVEVHTRSAAAADLLPAPPSVVDGDHPSPDGGVCGDEQLCTVLLVPPTAVPAACTSASAASDFLTSLAQTTGRGIVRCVAGSRAQAHAAQSESSAVLYALLWDMSPALIQHNLNNLKRFHPALQSVVHQAQADELSGASVATAAPALSALVDRLAAAAQKRANVIGRMKDSWFATPGIIVLLQEVLDGNAAHLHNLSLLTALLQGAALGASPGDYVHIVRMVAEWLQLQLLQLIQALHDRRAWMTGLSADAGLKGCMLKGIANLFSRFQLMRQRWMQLVM